MAAAARAGTGTTLRAAGGWVRDKLLGRDSLDIDIAIDNMLVCGRAGGRQGPANVTAGLLGCGQACAEACLEGGPLRVERVRTTPHCLAPTSASATCTRVRRAATLLRA